MTVLDAHRAFSIVASACLAPITAHPDTHPERDAERYRAAAVLLPIVAGRRSLDLLFTVRAQHLKVHPGQISFPGGHVEREDADVAATAVRETHEEVGIAPATVRILGCLPPCTTGSGYRVVPVVGLIPSGLVYRIDPYEVEAAFHVPLAHLLAPEKSTPRAQTQQWAAAFLSRHRLRPAPHLGGYRKHGHQPRRGTRTQHGIRNIAAFRANDKLRVNVKSFIISARNKHSSNNWKWPQCLLHFQATGRVNRRSRMDRKSCIHVLVLSAALIMLSACASVTPEQLSAVQSQASSAASAAGKAASDAASALSTAQAAQSTADAAKAAADAAQSTADAAMACCNENKDRIERMFEQTMKK